MLKRFAEIKLEEKGNKMIAEISECKICPKAIEEYEFEGTACPWGGILAGLLEEYSSKSFSMNMDLNPGKTCKITLI